MLSKTFGCTRMVYNHYLDKRIRLYEEEKITFGYTKCANDLTALKKEKELKRKRTCFFSFSTVLSLQAPNLLVSSAKVLDEVSHDSEPLSEMM